jgi:hypothetical protein
MDITSVRSRRFSVTRRNLLAGRFARIPDGEWTRQLAGQLALNAARGPATCSSTMPAALASRRGAWSTRSLPGGLLNVDAVAEVRQARTS